MASSPTLPAARLTDTHAASMPAHWRDFVALTKPRVMTLVVFTGLCGLLAAPGSIHPVLAFTAIGSLGVAAPVLAHAILGERAATPLERGKGWLDRNSTALTVGVLAVLGVLLLAKGLPAAT